MSVRKFKAGLITSIVLDQYVGEEGVIFYNPVDGEMRLSDGHTPGGIPLNGGAGSSPVTISSADGTIAYTKTSTNHGETTNYDLTVNVSKLKGSDLKLALSSELSIMNDAFGDPVAQVITL